MTARRALVIASFLLTLGWAPLRTGAEDVGTTARSDANAGSAAPAYRRAEYLDQFYRHFAGQRARALVEMLPADMSWHMIGWREDVVPFAGLYSGRDRILEFFTDYLAAIVIREYRFQYRLVDGDRVSWHFRLVADVPATGKTFDAEFTHVWQFAADGTPVFCRSYYDTQLQAEAFRIGGPTELKDRQNPSDDFRVTATPYDVQGLVTSVYDRFYAGDIQGALALLADDAAIYFKGKDNPVSGEYHGLAGALQFVYNLAGTAAPYDIVRTYVTEGDRTDVVLFENWIVFATGKTFHVHTVNSWRVNGAGKLLGFINYPDMDDMAAAYVP
jgi:ketosteroid isomerase-like protein